MGIGKIIELIVILISFVAVEAWTETIMLKKRLLFGVGVPISDFAFVLFFFFYPILMHFPAHSINAFRIVDLILFAGFLSSLTCLILHLARGQNGGKKE